MPHAFCHPSVQACKTRRILTLQQAVHIFKMKLHQSNPSSRGTAAVISKSFGVSEKAVRDIWTGRTWVRETMHLDPARAAKAAGLSLPGRPKRSKTGGNHNHHRPCCLPDRSIGFTSETTLCIAISGTQESPPDPSSQARPLAMMMQIEAPGGNDPFHDDWPHWAAAGLWEQRAGEAGYIPNPTTLSV